MQDHIIKKCLYCQKGIKLRLITKIKNQQGEILKADKNKKFCSTACLNKWQKEVKWEDRVGKATANKIRTQTSLRVKGDKNPSCRKEVAEKISESLKKHLKENPRVGEKNPFYGKKHSETTKKHLSESKKDKWAYNEEQYLKQKQSTPKGKNHPNWKDGSSQSAYENFTNVIKREIKERDSYKCCICNKETQKLAVHHIDYDKKNSNLNNLISLCFKCHGETNFNRNSWQLLFENYMNENINRIEITFEEDVLTSNDFNKQWKTIALNEYAIFKIKGVTYKAYIMQKSKVRVSVIYSKGKEVVVLLNNNEAIAQNNVEYDFVNKIILENVIRFNQPNFTVDLDFDNYKNKLKIN